LEPKCLKRGAVLRLKVDPKIMLDSGAEKVVHLDAPRLDNGTLGTSKVKEFLRRGCQIQLFTLFSWKALFARNLSSKRLVLGAFRDSF